MASSTSRGLGQLISVDKPKDLGIEVGCGCGGTPPTPMLDRGRAANEESCFSMSVLAGDGDGRSLEPSLNGLRTGPQASADLTTDRRLRSTSGQPDRERRCGMRVARRRGRRRGVAIKSKSAMSVQPGSEACPFLPDPGACDAAPQGFVHRDTNLMGRYERIALPRPPNRSE